MTVRSMLSRLTKREHKVLNYILKWPGSGGFGQGESWVFSVARHLAND